MPIAGCPGDLVGGEDRLDPSLFNDCGDSLILNFGSPDQPEDGREDPRELTDWHIDGDWFTHYLDSGEQALTVLHLYTDVSPDGCGATMICEDGIKDMCEYLRANPQGTNMRDGKGGNAYEAIKRCSKFTELHGKAGDVFLAHPFMVRVRSADDGEVRGAADRVSTRVHYPHLRLQRLCRTLVFIASPTITSPFTVLVAIAIVVGEISPAALFSRGDSDDRCCHLPPVYIVLPGFDLCSTSILSTMTQRSTGKSFFSHTLVRPTFVVAFERSRIRHARSRSHST